MFFYFGHFLELFMYEGMPESLWKHHQSKVLDFYIETVSPFFSIPSGNFVCRMFFFDKNNFSKMRQFSKKSKKSKISYEEGSKRCGVREKFQSNTVIHILLTFNHPQNVQGASSSILLAKVKI